MFAHHPCKYLLTLHLTTAQVGQFALSVRCTASEDMDVFL